LPSIEPRELYAVLVQEHVSDVLTGHRDHQYASPPQPLESALVLAALLGAGKLTDVGQAKVAIAGGRRIVTIELTTPDAHHTASGSASD
jgi:hypothetical protein